MTTTEDEELAALAQPGKSEPQVERVDVLRPYISWSGLKRYEECHQHHYRVIKRQTMGVKDTRIFLPGTVADRVMREWLESDDPRPGQMAKMVPDMLAHHAGPEGDGVVKWRGNPDRDFNQVRNFVVDVVTKLEPILLKHVVPYDYHPELRFSTTIGIPYLDGRLAGCNLIGGIDVAVRQAEDHYVLFDLKATANKDYIPKVLGQAIFYDIAFGHWIGDPEQPVKFGFIAPALEMGDEPIWATISEDDRRVMMARIVAMAHGIWRDEWEPKESDSGCRWCDAYHVCDKWAVDAKLDAEGRNRASFGKAAARRKRVRDLHRTKGEEAADA